MLLGCSILLYIAILLIVAFRTTKTNTNVDFYNGGRRSRWWMISIGMVGASISGVTFVSVPGWVTSTHFSYLQMVAGFFVGYLLIAYLLLPIYYSLNEVSIYASIEKHIGKEGRRTAAYCFITNKLFGSAIKLYVVIVILQQLLINNKNVSFELITFIALVFVWIYTYKGGIKTIVWTDFIQTILLVAALLLLIRAVLHLLDINLAEAIRIVAHSPLSTTIVWDDWHSSQHFLKQFISGIFIVFVMTGMDQDLMQKNLACKTLKESQRNMLTYGILFLPLNLLFLSLGVLVVTYYQSSGILPAEGDALLPHFAQQSGEIALTCFVIGMAASSFSSVDSAITSITTSILTDFHLENNSKKHRILIHTIVTIVLFVCVLTLRHVESNHAIDLVYTLVAFLFGPLLGMFLHVLQQKGEERKQEIRWVPLISVASIILTYLIKEWAITQYKYAIGYEAILLNGVFMYIGLQASRYLFCKEINS